jgi:hypothetical protein
LITSSPVNHGSQTTSTDFRNKIGQKQKCKFWRTDGLPVSVGWHLVIKKVSGISFCLVRSNLVFPSQKGIEWNPLCWLSDEATCMKLVA